MIAKVATSASLNPHPLLSNLLWFLCSLPNMALNRTKCHDPASACFPGSGNWWYAEAWIVVGHIKLYLQVVLGGYYLYQWETWTLPELLDLLQSQTVEGGRGSWVLWWGLTCATCATCATCHVEMRIDMGRWMKVMICLIQPKLPKHHHHHHHQHHHHDQVTAPTPSLGSHGSGEGDSTYFTGERPSPHHLSVLSEFKYFSCFSNFFSNYLLTFPASL